MAKKVPSKKSEYRPVTVEHFRKFLAAADAVAQELLLRKGVLADPRTDRDFYWSAVTRLTEEFGGVYNTTGSDDVIHLEEHTEQLDAAHMIGLALGLRLRASGIDALIGGAR